MQEVFNGLHYGHTFSMVFSNQTSTDYYQFSAQLEDSYMNEAYLNLIPKLKHFIAYFLDQIASNTNLVIAYERKLSPSNHDRYLSTEIPFTKDNLTYWLSQKQKRIYINGGATYLTIREFESLHWISKGKTLAETDMILGITTRTMKAHINNIKHKFNIRNQLQLEKGENQTLKVYLVVGTEAGNLFALDQDKNGKFIWRKKVSIGGDVGGLHFGASTDNINIFIDQHPNYTSSF